MPYERKFDHYPIIFYGITLWIPFLVEVLVKNILRFPKGYVNLGIEIIFIPWALIV